MEAPRFDTNGMCIKERISKFSKVLANADMETVLVKNELILCLKGHFALTDFKSILKNHLFEEWANKSPKRQHISSNKFKQLFLCIEDIICHTFSLSY